ncbi:MAG TPA: hypothetical protein DCE55_16565 [Planctomycetaceae bacterium]|nr:hypothetical protein [Planctomycetaceae bacterium]
MSFLLRLNAQFAICGGRTLPLCDILETPLLQVVKTCIIRCVNHDDIVSHWVVYRQVRNSKGPFAVSPNRRITSCRRAVFRGGQMAYESQFCGKQLFPGFAAGPLPFNLP